LATPNGSVMIIFPHVPQKGANPALDQKRIHLFYRREPPFCFNQP